MTLSLQSISFLKETILFSNLSDDNLIKISSESKDKTLQPGEFVFHQGDSAKYFYFLVYGQIKLTRVSNAGNEKVINIIKPKMLFAESVAFNEIAKYPVNAISITESNLIAIPSNTFIKVLHKSPKLCIKTLAALSMKLHFLINEVDRLTLHNASYRLISYLFDNSDNENNIRLVAPKYVIASRLSIKPETLSRTLKQLSKLNLIKVHNNRIELLDVESLKKLIEIE